MGMATLDRRNARIYLVGLAASVLGNSAMTLVAGIWVKALTGSSSAAALTAACIYLPSLFSPLAGVVVDRARRVPTLLVVNLASAVVMLALLLVHSVEQVWLVYLVMLGYGTSLILIGPAENALFTAMLPGDVRQQANGTRLALQEGSKLVAPLLGAGLFVAFGGPTVAALDAATFVVAALAVLRLRFDEPKPHREQRRLLAELAAGFRHLRAVAPLRATTAAATIAMAVSGFAAPAQYSLVDALHRPPSFLGVLTGLLGAGSIVAGLTSGPLIKRIGERRLAVFGLVNGTASALLRATGSCPAAVSGTLVSGFALPWTVVSVINLMQRTTPDRLQGRVSSAVTLALFAPQPIVQALGAAAIARVDFRAVYLTSALVTLATGLILALRSQAA